MSDSLSQLITRLEAFLPSLLCTYLFLVPIMWSPFPYNIQWADLAFIALFLCFLVGRRSIDRPLLIPLDYFVFTYLAVSGVSLLNIQDGDKQWVEFLKLGYLGAIYLVIAAISRNRFLLHLAIRWTAWLTVGVSGIGLLALFGVLIGLFSGSPLGGRLHTPYLGEILRLYSTFPGPELLGDYLTAGLPFVLALAIVSQKNSRPWLSLGALAVVAAEFFTFSHSWVGFGASGLILCWPISESRAWRLARAVLTIGIVGSFAVMLLVSTFYVSEIRVDLNPGRPPTTPVPVHARVAPQEWKSIDVNATYSLMSYHLLKALAWETFLAHPLTGVGRGNFDSVSTRAVQEGHLAEYWKGIHPHTSIFGEFAETGLVGGTAFLALWAGALATALDLWRREKSLERRWMARAVLAALAGLFINGLYTDVMNFRFLWVVLALLRGLSAGKEERAPSSQP